MVLNKPDIISAFLNFLHGCTGFVQMAELLLISITKPTHGFQKKKYFCALIF